MSEQKSSGENSSEDNLPGENSLHSVKHSSYSRDLWFVVTSVPGLPLLIADSKCIKSD